MAYVIKSSGKKEEFNVIKLRRSLLEAGASEALADDVLRSVSREGIPRDMPTDTLVEIVSAYLKKQDKGITARYNLKKALLELGPAGYSFEQYFARLLEEHGYQVQVNRHLKGKHIMHEVDIIATKDKRFMIECKYHNKNGITTRVKDPLYVYARFLDLKPQVDVPWLATNTKCTQDVIEYARGVAMRITAWDYPKEHSLKKLIHEEKLYPITALRSISHESKERLFAAQIYLIKDLFHISAQELARRTKFKKEYVTRIIHEAQAILT